MEILIEKLWDQFFDKKDNAMKERDHEEDSMDSKTPLDGESGLYPHLAGGNHLFALVRFVSETVKQ